MEQIKKDGSGVFLESLMNSAVNPSGPNLYFERRLLITAPISLPLMDLFMFSCLRPLILATDIHLEVHLPLMDCPVFQRISFCNQF